MTAVNWTDPSEGLVSDPKPALNLRNNKGGALVAKSRGMAAFAFAPHNTAVAGGNQTGLVPAVGGVCLQDPGASSNLAGMGVLGAADRFSAIGVYGAALHERSIGVLGQAENASKGVVGRGSLTGVEGTASHGDGVAGYTKSQGDDAGVFGAAMGDGGAGVRGEALAGPGVEAHSLAGPGVSAASDQAHGIMGSAKAANASGVLGRNDGAAGTGVDGYSDNGIAVRATSSKGTALRVKSLSGPAIDAETFTPLAAVKVSAPAGTGATVLSGAVGLDVAAVKAGVFSVSIGPAGGDFKSEGSVQGFMFTGAGVKGKTMTGVGVHGVGLPALGAWAGYFEGDVHVTGFLFKAASLFSIDHPLDPQRKVLNHASVESPEYKTFYDGVCTLGSDGRRLVKLPKWFSALNRDARHQLTPLGGPAADLHVRAVRKDSFVVAGGKPGQRVCWQVTGIRRDAWARAHPLEVEQPKRRARRGVRPTSAADLRRLAASAHDENDLRAAAGRIAVKTKLRAVAPPARRRTSPPSDGGLGTERVDRLARSAVAAVRSRKR